MKEGWEIKKLGEIADFEYGFTDKSLDEGEFRYVRITDINSNGELIPINKKYIKYSKEAESFLVRNNELLMVRTGATFAKILLYKDLEPSVFASYLIRIEFKENINNKLYWYFSKSKSYWEQASKLVSGAAQPHFNSNAVGQILFSYPKSPQEQQRIISILDKAFEAIDKAKANVEQNLKNSKEVFNNYLNRIFETQVNGSKLCKLGEICTFVRGPFGGSLKKNIFKEEGYAVYEQQHAIHNQFNKIRYFIDEDKFNEMKRFELKSGDLIMSCSGTMGKVAIAPNEIRKGVINQALLKISTGKEISNTFLKLWMESPSFQTSLSEYAGGAAIQNVASVATLKNINIPLPSKEVQQIIVEKSDSFQAESKKLELIYQKKLNCLEELKKSILQKAFAGELTS